MRDATRRKTNLLLLKKKIALFTNGNYTKTPQPTDK